jgi:hypothetical protein
MELARHTTTTNRVFQMYEYLITALSYKTYLNM